MQLIPKYDGTGDAQKLMEYIEGFEQYIAFDDELSPTQQLALAVGKLSGDVKMWWREHRFSGTKKIKTWDALRTALIETYAPSENSDAVRDKL